MKQLVWAPLVVALAVTVAAGCSSGGDAGGGPAAPAAPAAPIGPPGKLVYAQSCARCHGYDGAPLKSATPVLSTARMSGLGDQTLTLLIRSGKGQMPAFGALTDLQVTDLIAYLRTL